MSKGVTEISRKGTASGLTSLSGHYELNKLSEDVNKRLENLEDRLAVAELKLFELEKNAKSRRSSRKYNSDTES